MSLQAHVFHPLNKPQTIEICTSEKKINNDQISNEFSGVHVEKEELISVFPIFFYSKHTKNDVIE